MSKTRHSKKWYDNKAPAIIRSERKDRKYLAKIKKAKRRHKRKKDMAVEKYGIRETYSPCTRKKRYTTRFAAQKQIRRSELRPNTPPLSMYKCPYCGGWHLTSHPRSERSDKDGGDVLTVLEVFEAARDAARRMRAIEEESTIRRERVGVQGHGYEVHAKSGILDPMRKVDDLLDWQDDQENTLGLEALIDEAWDVIGGIATLGDDFAVELVTRHYLYCESWAHMVRGGDGARPMDERVEMLKGIPRDRQAKYLRKAFREVLPEWERIGIAKLKQMGRSQ